MGAVALVPALGGVSGSEEDNTHLESDVGVVSDTANPTHPSALITQKSLSGLTSSSLYLSPDSPSLSHPSAALNPSLWPSQGVHWQGIIREEEHNKRQVR